MFFIEKQTQLLLSMKMLVITLLHLRYRGAVVAQSSGTKRKGDPLESASTAPPAKYQRSGLESVEKWNSWDLLPYLSSYVNWFMAIHSYKKEIREKSLISTPVSSNFKVSQKLDKYMQEGKKSKTLCWKNT